MKKILTIFGILFLLSSCNTMLTSKNIQGSAVTQIGSFETISLIRTIEKGNQSKHSDSLSWISTAKLDSIVIASNSPNIQKKFKLVNLGIQQRVERDILTVMGELKKARKIETIKSTPLLDSIVKSQNQRFGLCLINTGFERKKGNYGKQLAKGLGIGLLTLGMYTPVPYKANTTMYAMIFDSQNSSIVMYNFIPMVEKSPVEGKNLASLYNKIFQGYFRKTTDK